MSRVTMSRVTMGHGASRMSCQGGNEPSHGLGAVVVVVPAAEAALLGGASVAGLTLKTAPLAANRSHQQQGNDGIRHT
jgi:hypothetical protein